VLRQRSPLLQYILVCLSGGSYGFYWLYLMMRDTEQVNRKRRLHPRAFLITVAIAGVVFLGSVLYAVALLASGVFVSAAHHGFMLVSAVTLQMILLVNVVRTNASIDPTPRLSSRIVGAGIAALLTGLFYASLPSLQRKLNRFVRIRATTMISVGPRHSVADIS
jgi:membrane-associated HD superfamily phosphohydrolase